MEWYLILLQLISLDVKSLIGVLAWGNLAFFALSLAFLKGNDNISNRAILNRFLYSKMLQMIGWMCLFYRGIFADIISINLGNSCIYIGFFLEAYVLLELFSGMRKNYKKVLYIILIVDLILFNSTVLLGVPSNVRIIIASSAIISFFILPAFLFTFNKESSRFKRFLGSLLIIIILSFVARMIMAMIVKDVVLMSNNFVQSISFLMLTILMLINGTGFMLLIYENVNNQLKKLAIQDPLTRIHNRRFLLESAKGFFTFCKREELPISIIFIDIDLFKSINDDYGHAKGDEVLIRVAEIISENIREADICGRYGGEEFVIILPNTTEDTGIEVADRLRNIVEETDFLGTNERHITISLGIFSKVPREEEEIESYINYSDEAMYKAKLAGRNRVMIYSDLN